MWVGTITGLNYRQRNWTTGLTQTAINASFNAGQKLANSSVFPKVSRGKWTYAYLTNEIEPYT